ncbi:MAG: hypothetical protein LBD46_08475 [Endomicrobium sp.]|jgi:hypothetical protein|nr:hypothetical protein [Endomicrobium sp.]
MGWIGVAVSALGQLQQAQSQKQYFNYLSRLADIQGDQISKSAELENQDIYEQEIFELGQIDKEGKRLIGAQRAAAGAAGVGVDSVTFENILKDTLTSISEDESMVRRNAELAVHRNRQRAALEKINLKNQASLYGISGQNAMTAGMIGAGSTVLGGASQFAANRYNRRSLTA